MRECWKKRLESKAQEQITEEQCFTLKILVFVPEVTELVLEVTGYNLTICSGYKTSLC